MAGPWRGVVPPILGIGIGAMALLQFGYAWLLHRGRRFVITADRIQCERGLLAKQIDNLDMWRVNDIRYHRGLIESIFGVGRIVILSTDPSDPVLVFGPVHNSRHLFERLQAAQRQADRRQGVVRVEH